MKEVLITGASSGIGAATARLFSQKGWKVFLLGRSIEKLLKVQSELKNPSEILAFDLGKKDNFPLIQKKLLSLGANIHALVNNAGIFKPALFLDETETSWEEQLEVNLLAPIRLTRLLWPMLKKNKGCVTNVSSTLGLRPIPNTGAYSASKAALNNWTQTLALEGGDEGVRVNAICPGLVDTPIHAYHKSENPQHIQLRENLKGLQPLGRLGEPEDIANAIYFSCSEESSWMTGALVPVDGGVIITTRNP
jgi:NAD(P)-dependent dehydrogenase (short-subunit alcohol dehydrogenase family)